MLFYFLLITLKQCSQYTLDQAIEKLSKENVGDYSKNDLVHYWLNGFIEFYTTIFYNIESLQLGNIEIKNEDLLVFQFSGTGNIALELSKKIKKHYPSLFLEIHS